MKWREGKETTFQGSHFFRTISPVGAMDGTGRRGLIHDTSFSFSACLVFAAVNTTFCRDSSSLHSAALPLSLGGANHNHLSDMGRGLSQTPLYKEEDEWQRSTLVGAFWKAEMAATDVVCCIFSERTNRCLFDKKHLPLFIVGLSSYYGNKWSDH